MRTRRHPALWPLAGVLAACVFAAVLAAVPTRAQGGGSLGRSVVRMYCQTSGTLSSGTAFVVAPGVVATNHHVIDCVGQGGSLFAVLAPSEILPTRVRWSNSEQDLALVEVPGLNRPPVRLASDAFVEAGDDVRAVGFPGAADLDGGDPRRITAEKLVPTVTRGIVSRSVEIDGVPVYQTDARISGGNSGGPLFDRCGDVIGVNTFVSAREGAYGYAVRASVLARAMQQNGLSAETAPARCDDRAAPPAAAAPPVAPAPVAAPPPTVEGEPGGLPAWVPWTAGGVGATVLLFGLLAFALSRRARAPEPPSAFRAGPTDGWGAAPPTPPPPPRPGATVVGTAGPFAGQRFALQEGTPLVFGRDARQCSVVLPENANTVSKRHALIGIEHGRAFVQDLGSTNGTYVGGHRLASGQRAALGAGQTVSLGHPHVSFAVQG